MAFTLVQMYWLYCYDLVRLN